MKSVTPLHISLANSFCIADALLVSARLIRRLMAMLIISQRDTEILLDLSTRTEPATFHDVCDVMPHLSKDRAKRSLKFLDDKGFLDISSIDDDHGVAYSAKSFVRKAIESLDNVSVA